MTEVINLDNCRIARPDVRNWVLQQKRPPTEKHPEERWALIGYYGKLEDLAAKLLTLNIQPSPDLDLKGQLDDLLRQIKESERRLTKMLEEHVNE